MDSTAAIPPAPVGGDATSLVSNRVSLAGLVPCRDSGGYVLRSDATGAWAPMPCQRNVCETCGPRKALATAIAVGMAEPAQFVTLTQVGDSSQRVRARLSDFRRRLRERGYSGEMWGVIEPNPKGTGQHFHGWRRGGFVPQRVLSDVADRCGMGRVSWVTQYRSGVFGVLYGTKTVGGNAGYGLKLALEDGGLSSFLERHGGRYGIWSRDFFGMPYREAVKAALTRPDREGHDPGPWRVRSLSDSYRFGA